MPKAAETPRASRRSCRGPSDAVRYSQSSPLAAEASAPAQSAQYAHSSQSSQPVGSGQHPDPNAQFAPHHFPHLPADTPHGLDTLIDPTLREYLDALSADIRAGMAQINQSIAQMVTTLVSKEQIEVVFEKLAAIHLQQLEIMKAHNAGFQSVPVYRIGSTGEGGQRAAAASGGNVSAGSGSGFGGPVQGLGAAGTSAVPPTSTSASTFAPPATTPIHLATSHTRRSSSPLVPHAHTGLWPEPPYYGMLKNVNTVQGLWREWTLDDPITKRPSVQAMDAMFGEGKWTDDSKVPDAQRWYRRRRAVVRYIMSQPEYTIFDPMVAVMKVAGEMKEKKWSLHQLCIWCVQQNKEVKAAEKAEPEPEAGKTAASGATAPATGEAVSGSDASEYV